MTECLRDTRTFKPGDLVRRSSGTRIRPQYFLIIEIEPKLQMYYLGDPGNAGPVIAPHFMWDCTVWRNGEEVP